MSDVKSAYKALTPEQQAVVGEQRVSGQRTPDEWLQFLTPIAEYDTKADDVRQSSGGFFARRFARKHDVPNILREFALPLLPILREDHDPNAPLELTLDLTGPEQPSKQASGGGERPHSGYPKIVDTFYDDPWLQGRAKFVDGADVSFSVTDHVRVTRKTKRSSSGKIKHKQKNKARTEIAVSISFPVTNYGAASEAAAQEGFKKAAVKPGEKNTVVRMSRVVDRGYDPPDVDLLLEVIAAAYARVDPTRKKKL